MWSHLRGSKPSSRMVFGFHPTGFWAEILAVGFCFAFGCGAKTKLPSTYPVRGKVVFRQGGVLSGGTIFFQSQVNSSVTAASQIGEDGTFELQSFIAGHQSSGAIAGAHRVVITPAFTPGVRQMNPPPPQIVKVFEGDNNLTITLEKQ